MSAAITCTSCNRPLRVPESVLGQTVQCPLCLDEFTAQADPAAEAAARAAESPVKRAARPQAVAAHVQAELDQAPLVEVEEEPIPVVPIAEVVPTKAAGKPGEQRALVFPVLVTRDPDRVLRGRMDGELTADGLYLRRMRQAPAFAAVGGRARYLGANRLVVTVEGREVELAIAKSWTSTYHLARDTAAFLAGKGPLPDGRAYRLPWYLFALPALFVALPSAAIPYGLLTDGCLGAFLWCAVTLGLAGLTTAVVLQPWLRPRGRLIGAAAVLGLGAAIFLIAIPFTPSYTVDPSLWQSYSPPSVGLTVLMPGAPTTARSGLVNGNVTAQKFTVDVTDPEVQFAVFVAPAPANDPNAFQPFGPNLNYQAINDAKALMQEEYGANGFNSVIAQYPERDLPQYGRPAHEVTYTVIPDYGFANRQTKTLATRIYVVNGKVYTLAVFGPRVKADGADVVKFFNSVQFTTPSKTVAPLVGSPADLPGLLAYWSFDQGDQFGRFADDSGHGLIGTAHLATIIADGRRGSAMHFNGRGSYFDFNNAQGLNFGQGAEFTFCGWVRTVANQGFVFSDRASLNGSADIDLSIQGGTLRLEVRPDGNEFNQPTTVNGRGAINDGAWHHFAVIRRGVGAIALYIDGVSQGQQQDFRGAGPITTDLHALGAELFWQKQGMGNSIFAGDIDEFCIYNRALNDDEIQKLAGGP